MEMTEDGVSELEGRTIDILQPAQQRRLKVSEQSLRDPCDNNRSNIYVCRVPGEERECGAQKIFEECNFRKQT